MGSIILGGDLGKIRAMTKEGMDEGDISRRLFFGVQFYFDQVPGVVETEVGYNRRPHPEPQL